MPEEYKTTDLNPVFAWFYRCQLGAIILTGICSVKGTSLIDKNAFGIIRTVIRPCGAMDNASDYGSEDSRFKSWQGRHFEIIENSKAIWFRLLFSHTKFFRKWMQLRERVSAVHVKSPGCDFPHLQETEGRGCAPAWSKLLPLGSSLWGTLELYDFCWHREGGGCLSCFVVSIGTLLNE